MFRKLLNFLFGKPPAEPIKDTWKAPAFPSAPPPAPPAPQAAPAAPILKQETMNPKAEWPFVEAADPAAKQDAVNAALATKAKEEVKKPRKPRAAPAPATKEKAPTKKKKK